MLGGRRWIIPIAAIALIAIVVSLVGGIGIANRALTPTATCADGTLEFAGSTAFAPVINQVAQEYMQACPQARISVLPDGSGNGLKDLENPPRDTTVIAMYDGRCLALTRHRPPCSRRCRWE